MGGLTAPDFHHGLPSKGRHWSGAARAIAGSTARLQACRDERRGAHSGAARGVKVGCVKVGIEPTTVMKSRRLPAETR